MQPKATRSQLYHNKHLPGEGHCSIVFELYTMIQRIFQDFGFCNGFVVVVVVVVVVGGGGGGGGGLRMVVVEHYYRSCC